MRSYHPDRNSLTQVDKGNSEIPAAKCGVGEGALTDITVRQPCVFFGESLGDIPS